MKSYLLMVAIVAVFGAGCFEATAFCDAPHRFGKWAQAGVFALLPPSPPQDVKGSFLPLPVEDAAAQSAATLRSINYEPPSESATFLYSPVGSDSPEAVGKLLLRETLSRQELDRLASHFLANVTAAGAPQLQSFVEAVADCRADGCHTRPGTLREYPLHDARSPADIVARLGPPGELQGSFGSNVARQQLGRDWAVEWVVYGRQATANVGEFIVKLGATPVDLISARVNYNGAGRDAISHDEFARAVNSILLEHGAGPMPSGTESSASCW